MPAGRTPLHVLAGPLHRLSGSNRFYNLLEREGFAYVEEVAATPDGCLLELRNSGMKFIAAVRQVLADLEPGGASATSGSRPGPGGAGQAAGGPAPPAGMPADAAMALQVVAAWAIAERGAQELGDLLTFAPGLGDLPPDVARSWDRIRQAPGRRTYDSLAAELGVGRERVRQLETSALQQLARAAAHDRYRPLRWRAASATQPGSTNPAAVIPGAPPWMGKLLSWLAGTS